MTKEEFLKLKRKERLVLEFYAFLGEFGIDYRHYDRLIKHLKSTNREFESIRDEFKKKGLIEGGWYKHSIRPEAIFDVLALTCETAPEDITLLDSIVKIPEAWAYASCIRNAIDGKPCTLPDDAQVATWQIADRAIDYPWGGRFLDAYDGDFRRFIACNSVTYSEMRGTPLTDAQLEALFATAHGADSQLAKDLADYRALYLYARDGVCSLSAANSPSRPYEQILRGIVSANAGSYAQAAGHFAAACKVLNSSLRIKNVIPDFFGAYYMAMTYARLGTPAALSKLRQYVKKKDIDNDPSQMAAIILALAFTSETHMPPEAMLRRAQRISINSAPATNINALAMMASTYFGMGDYTREIKSFKLNFAIMRHELSAYLPLSDDERASLAEKYGDKPMLTSLRRKQDWEWAIDEVISSIDAEASDKMARAKSERIVYMIGPSSPLLVPCVQTWLKAGRWSTAKPIPRKRFNEGEEPGMDDTDRMVAAEMYINPAESWRGAEYPSIFDAGHLLIGSDRVFLDEGGNRPKTPVAIDKTEPYLQVKKDQQGKRIVVGSNISLKDVDSRSSHIVIKNSPISYSVCSITPTQREVFRKLLSLGQFPASAEESVKHMLSRVEEISEVRSPMLDSKSMPQLAGSTLLVARVTPGSGMAYHVDFMARPVADSSMALEPGEGRAVVYELVDGKNARIKRDLKGEAEALADLMDQVEGLADVSDGSNTVRLTVDGMLEIIDYASQNPDKLLVEWTEGKKLSLSKADSPSAWSIGLKSKGDWFEIEGEVRLDQGQSLAISSLLDLMAGSKSRYVRLSDTDYIEISGRLRKQLARLEAVAVKNRSKSMVSPLNAALLDDKVLDGEIKIAFDSKLASLRKKIAESLDSCAQAPSGLSAQLRPYQTEGFQWMARLASWGAGACLADDMGLGKTVQTIAFMLLKAADGPALVVAPASVAPNWVSELARFAPSLKATVLNRAADRAEALAAAAAYDVVISTYGILNTESDRVAEKEWATVVLDEAHIIKNRETKMSAAVMKLKAANRLILTGTPIQNHLGELWNLFRFINPGLLGSYDSFRQRFVNPIQDGDKDRQQALQRIIKPFMLRRTKADVIDDLPDKSDIVVPVELSDGEMAMYETMRQKAAEAIKADNKVSVSTLAEITKLRRAACSMRLVENGWAGADSKTQAFVDMAEDFKGTSNRMLVFSQFTSYLAIVRQALDKAGIEYLYLDGSTPMSERERLVKEFRTGSAPLFLISLKAGGLGLNLPEANYVAHLDPWWNPAIEQQATDRAYRIGQKRNVTVYHFVAENTIEMKIRRLHRTKRDLADSLLEGSDMAAKLTLADVMNLVSNT